MSFYMAPEDNFDKPEEAKIWEGRSFEAAGRSKKPASRVRKMLGLMDMKASVHDLGQFSAAEADWEIARPTTEMDSFRQ